jgi:lysophospholipase L1-like esterase
MKTVLVFGDSNSWGWNPANDLIQPIFRWDDETRWAGVMEATLGDDYKVIVDGLNGRTTVWDDPIEEYRCGKYQIIPTMDAQAPFDLIIIFVGTNDLKCRYTVTPQDIANGAGLLVAKALNQAGAFVNQEPKVLLIGPPPLGPIENGVFSVMFGGNEKKSEELAGYYKGVAAAYGVDYFDAGKVVKSSAKDGLHLEADQHKLLGEALAKKVMDMLS